MAVNDDDIPDTSSPIFPPDSWLGYGLNLIEACPTDIDSVTTSIRTVHRVLQISEDRKVQTIHGLAWNVPANVHVTPDTLTTKSNEVVYKSGIEASEALQTDVSVKGDYMAVSGSADFGYGINKNYKSSKSYYWYTFGQDILQVHYNSWGDSVNDSGLKKALRVELKKETWNPKDPDTVQSYRNLFNKLGTHIVTGATYGCRLTLNAWADTMESSKDTVFKAHVQAQYHGVANVEADASVTGSTEYKEYSEVINKNCLCKGGDAESARQIEASPEDGKTGSYRGAWLKSLTKNPHVLSLAVQAPWEVIAESEDEKVAALSNHVENAYVWICANPQTHITSGVLSITSDWGSFALLNPSATLKMTDNVPEDVKKCIKTSSTSISWNGMGSAVLNLGIGFTIENDGSPVDIVTSHGTDGIGDQKGGKGSVIVAFAGKIHDNTGKRDNGTNSLKFYGCPVNSNPVSK